MNPTTKSRLEKKYDIIVLGGTFQWFSGDSYSCTFSIMTNKGQRSITVKRGETMSMAIERSI